MVKSRSLVLKMAMHTKEVQTIQQSISWMLKYVDVKKNSFGQSKRYKKKHNFFFRQLHLITVFLLICDSYTS